jgi:hypothetical protein
VGFAIVFSGLVAFADLNPSHSVSDIVELLQEKEEVLAVSLE